MDLHKRHLKHFNISLQLFSHLACNSSIALPPHMWVWMILHPQLVTQYKLQWKHVPCKLKHKLTPHIVVKTQATSSSPTLSKYKVCEYAWHILITTNNKINISNQLCSLRTNASMWIKTLFQHSIWICLFAPIITKRQPLWALSNHCGHNIFMLIQTQCKFQLSLPLK
jgi:hypothetical protein